LAASGAHGRCAPAGYHPALGAPLRAGLHSTRSDPANGCLISLKKLPTPMGHTPVLRHRFGWKRLSLAGALACEPDGSDAHLFFQLRPGAYNDETLIEFLSELNDFEQRRVVPIWDGLPSHGSGRMRAWVD